MVCLGLVVTRALAAQEPPGEVSDPVTRATTNADRALPSMDDDAVSLGTWRLDFFQTGDATSEVLSLDAVRVEPLPWSSPVGDAVQPSTLGVYRYLVWASDGQLLASRGFSPLFAEWQSTAEASRVRRSFHESLRFPEPDGPVDIVVERRDAQNDFREIWRLTVDPDDIFIDRRPSPQLTALAFENNGPPREKVDLLLIGDGYIAAECASAFPGHAQRMVDALFAAEPFASRRQDFNVWGLCPPAQASGVSRPSRGVQAHTPAGSTYDVFGSERYLLSVDNQALRSVAAWAPYEFIVVLANGPTYGGGGLFGRHAAVSMASAFSEYVFVHELGHHFAGLADEYYTSPVAYQPPAQVTEPWEPNVTALLDPGTLKWGSLIDAGVAVPTLWPKGTFEEYARDFQAKREALRARNVPEAEMDNHFLGQKGIETALLGASENADKVGAFRGANYDAEAFFRPQIDCKMFTRNDVPFCAVCRRALEAVIDRFAP